MTTFERISLIAKGKLPPSTPGGPRTKSPSFGNSAVGSISGRSEGPVRPPAPTAQQLAEQQRIRVNQQAPVDPARAAAYQLEQEKLNAEKNRLRGRASTLQTTGFGLLDAPNVTRRTLSGY